MAPAPNPALELYLHSGFQPGAEFIDGEIRERPIGEYDRCLRRNCQTGM